MDRTVFLEQMDGLMVEQVVRDREYSMYSQHFHESYEMYFLLAGERYYFIDRETYLVKAGMGVMVMRNQIHKTSMAGSSYHDRLLLQVDSGVFSPYMKVFGLPPIQDLFQRLDQVIEYTQQEWETVLKLLEALKQELKERRSGYEAAARMLVMHILILTGRCQQVSQSSGHGRSDRPVQDILIQDNHQAQTAKHQKIREVTEYLLIHYDSNESQEELAKRFFVSKSYLCRIFKEVTGFTLNEYQNLARIKAARQLLTNTDLSVTEIAGQVGFESITYFERVFKKLTGERPLQYRKNYR